MKKIVLRVPDHQRRLALEMGAEVDPETGDLVVPEGEYVSDYKSWVAAYPYINIRAEHYWIFAAPCRCPGCGVDTKYYGYWVPEEHETEDDYEYDDDLDIEMPWRTVGADLRLTYVKYLTPSVLAEMTALTDGYFLDTEPDNHNPYNPAPGKPYYANHCHTCRRIITDEEMTHEVGPLGNRIEFYPVGEKFEANAGSHVSEGLFGLPPGND